MCDIVGYLVSDCVSMLAGGRKFILLSESEVRIFQRHRLHGSGQPLFMLVVQDTGRNFLLRDSYYLT